MTPEPGLKPQKHVGTYADVCLPQAMQFLDDVFADIGADDEVCFFTDDGLGRRFPKGSLEILPFLNAQYGRDVRLSLVSLRGRVFGFYANFHELPGRHDSLWSSASLFNSEHGAPCVWLFDKTIDLYGNEARALTAFIDLEIPVVIPGTYANGDLWRRSDEFELVKHDVATLTKSLGVLAADYKLAGCQSIQEFDAAGAEWEAREAEAQDAACNIEPVDDDVPGCIAELGNGGVAGLDKKVPRRLARKKRPAPARRKWRRF